MQLELGKFNRLKVVKEVDFGVYLDGGDGEEILLPARYVPEGCQPGDEVNVFLYLDNEERLVATTLKPLIQVGEFACLEVAWTNEYGAFLRWGLMKDLFVPFREQRERMQIGQRYVVHAHIDEESYRIMASSKVERYLSRTMPAYLPGDRVEVLIWQRSHLGYKAIVEGQYGGLIYANEVFRPLQIGDKLTAYVKQVRSDGKIDLELQKAGFQKVDDFAETLLAILRERGGSIPYGDKSPADAIYDAFQVSKKTFKKALGDLYKRRLVVLDDEETRLA